MKIQYTARLGAAALFAAWCWDQLFWGKIPGVSFLLFVLLVLGIGAGLTWGENLHPAKASLALVPPVLLFAGMSFLRQEPFTLFVDYLLTLSLLALLATTWLGGRWPGYSLSDYIVRAARLVLDTLVRPLEVYLAREQEDLPTKHTKEMVEHKAFNDPESLGNAAPSAPSRSRFMRGSWARPALSVASGLALALPVVALLASLLAAADPIFSQRLSELLANFRLEKLGEYAVRSAVILTGAYLLCGALLHALLSSREEKLTGDKKPWLPPFLGWLQAVIVLGCVDLLLASFVAVQFRYFFGGQANITSQGFTFAEYARRGFGELAAVAAISLLLFLGLSNLTRRVGRTAKWTFSGLGVGLVTLVAVILVSAFQRLLLYEAAYGFTRIRTTTHVFMIWLGLLLLGTAALELFGRLRSFALAALLAALGFSLTLNLLNVDGFIVHQNVARAAQGEPLDAAYLVSLSEDAAPALFQSFTSQSLPIEVRDELGGVLACRAALAVERGASEDWPSFHWANFRAGKLYKENQQEIGGYQCPVDRAEWVDD